MEERPVQTVHDNDLRISLAVSLAVADGLFNAVAAARASRSETIGANLLDIMLSSSLLLVESVLGVCGCTVRTTHVCDAEDRLPTLEDTTFGSRISKTSRRESSSRPSVVDVCKVPLHLLGSSVAIKLVANINEVLDRGDIDIVDRREIEDDSLEGGEIAVVYSLLSAARTRIVPWSVL